MIKVRCIGHIKNSLGDEEIMIDCEEISVDDLIDRLRDMAKDNGNISFNEYNTIVMIENGEAFVAANRDMKIRDGESVVLIPFSHGG